MEDAKGPAKRTARRVERKVASALERAGESIAAAGHMARSSFDAARKAIVEASAERSHCQEARGEEATARKRAARKPRQEARGEVAGGEEGCGSAKGGSMMFVDGASGTKSAVHDSWRARERHSSSRRSRVIGCRSQAVEPLPRPDECPVRHTWGCDGRECCARSIVATTSIMKWSRVAAHDLERHATSSGARGRGRRSPTAHVRTRIPTDARQQRVMGITGAQLLRTGRTAMLREPSTTRAIRGNGSGPRIRGWW